MESAINKSERLLQLELLLLSHPGGMRKAEIARRLSVHRSTIGRYIDELSVRLPLWEKENKFGIEKSKTIETLRISIYESISFHLAANALAIQLQIHNPYIASGIRKLSFALRSLAPFIANELNTSADTIDGASKKKNARYVENLKILTKAWMEQRNVRFQAKNEKGCHACVVSFLPEKIGLMNPVPYDNPVIVSGRCHDEKKSCSLKLRDIESVEILEPQDGTAG